MGPSTLDLFILTFNCAKNLVNVPVFAAHLERALGQNASGLPDLVVFSLQEVAPMSYGFIGSYFLSPYLARFEDALNIAAANFESAQVPAATPEDGGSTLPTPPFIRKTLTRKFSRRPTGPYQLIRSGNVGMTAILLFARQPSAIHHVRAAECGFGVADMGNKGAVGLRVVYADAGVPGSSSEGGDSHRTTELTFVATHLAPMEWNLNRRNANWRSIVSGLTFKNPKTVAEGLEGLGPGLQGRTADSAASAARTPDEEREEDAWLLSDSQAADLAEHHDTLRDISIFRPTAHLFVAGDLNYRIGSKTPPAQATFPSLAPGADNWAHFLERDQLTRERLAGRTFHGLSEAPVAFPPTYKYDVLDDERDGAEMPDKAVRWRFAPHRWPSWCDRVLYLEVPAWVPRRLGGDGPAAAEKVEVQVRAYGSLPLMRASDHQAVFFRAAVPLLSAAEMAPPPEGELRGEEADDPRVRLPVPVDVDAWERRAAARKREVAVGWSMLLWSTREGAMVIGTLLLVGVGSWWLYQAWY